MYQVESDFDRNTLRLTFSQQVGVLEAKMCREAVEIELKRLKPGFIVLTDLSNLEEMEFSCSREISSMMDECQKHGVGEVIRVIPEPEKDIGFTLMSFFHYGSEVAIKTCETLAEAAQILPS